VVTLGQVKWEDKKEGRRTIASRKPCHSFLKLPSPPLSGLPVIRVTVTPLSLLKTSRLPFSERLR
jgi:hypothetical protein